MLFWVLNLDLKEGADFHTVRCLYEVLTRCTEMDKSIREDQLTSNKCKVEAEQPKSN